MKKHTKIPRHAIAVCVILVLSILIGFAFDGGITLLERHTHPREYQMLVEAYAAEYDVPVSVVYAIIKSESDFDPAAVSAVGACATASAFFCPSVTLCFVGVADFL